MPGLVEELFRKHLTSRQANCKTVSLTRVAVDFNVSLVGMDNGLDKTQAKPETSPRTALVPTTEPVEYPVKVPMGNPHSIVFYKQKNYLKTGTMVKSTIGSALIRLINISFLKDSFLFYIDT
jgi:hypothetical protein